VRLADRKAYMEAQKQKYPWITTWDTLLAGMAYSDAPRAEPYNPDYRDNVWERIRVFGEQLKNGTDLQAQEDLLEQDLTALFNQ
jgi:hypothetical protein